MRDSVKFWKSLLTVYKKIKIVRPESYFEKYGSI